MAGLLELLSTPVGWILLIGVAALVVAPPLGVSGFRGPELERRMMAILVSLIILAAGLYVLLAGTYNPDTEKWAGGVIGLVVGYWLPANTYTKSH